MLGPYGHVVPRAAATVVLLRDAPDGPEVLLTHRPPTMAFAPDMHVFPGGAVDDDDADDRLAARSDLDRPEAAARLGGALDGRAALAVHVAAVRELFEEAGVFLGEAGSGGPPGSILADARTALLRGETSFLDVCEDLDLRLGPSRLIALSRWVTPPIMPRRFDARFFAATLPHGIEPTFEGDEIVDHRWVLPRTAIAGLADGTVRMWLPTSTNLQRLEHLGSAAEAVRFASLAEDALAFPEAAVVAPDVVRVIQPGGAGVDGLVVQAYLVGGREMVAVDAGDPSEEALLAIVEAASSAGGTIGAVVLTSADPDHAGGSEHLREGLSVLVHGGVDAGRPLPFPVGELGDGSAVPAGDIRMVAVAAPGPRPDHVMYWLPGSRSAIVGDLVGPAAARTIPGPADVGAWRASLARLRSLEAARLLPAHGEVVEGTEAVQAAIAAAEAAIEAGDRP
jgi:glyoxylase-like metal-dependent hydrolase (beta-lactamase superfamily II)/8-oxo-dGTP pyrophosphatase MutT (NUDIX family)